MAAGPASPPAPSYFHSSSAPRDLHSFPTRRSSDLRTDRLVRVRIGTLSLGKLKVGDWRELNQKEIADLARPRSEEHTSELQSRGHLVCRLLLEKKNRQLRLLRSYRIVSAVACLPCI